MTVKTTLSFTDRHHQFLSEKVGQGMFATQSAAVATALEPMMQDEDEREVALSALAQELRSRMETPRAAFTDQDDAFAAARRATGAERGARGVMYRIRFHPLVARDLDSVSHWIIDYSGPEMADIEAAIATQKPMLHKGRPTVHLA